MIHLIALVAAYGPAGWVPAQEGSVQLPSGFRIQTLASGLGSPRFLAVSPSADLFVALHGSWNRSVPTGYKVIRIPMQGARPGAPQDVATGWLQGSRASGRPVDVITGKDGALYVADDRAGVIYRISHSTR